MPDESPWVEPQWMVSPHDKGTHAFGAADDDGVSESLCERQLAMEKALIDPKEASETWVCVPCQLALGTLLADRYASRQQATTGDVVEALPPLAELLSPRVGG